MIAEALSYTDEDYCKNPLWIKSMLLPGYLEQQVLAMTSTKLIIYLLPDLKTDMSNEGIDGQAPNAQPTN